MKYTALISLLLLLLVGGATARPRALRQIPGLGSCTDSCAGATDKQACIDLCMNGTDKEPSQAITPGYCGWAYCKKSGKTAATCEQTGCKKPCVELWTTGPFGSVEECKQAVAQNNNGQTP
ncbi:hypothetical protein COHA_009496 [Chlorella ohadii]|uniref:Uncharacterized protein n=1 Tax=Chlorella ohadii TaxID=2649997 RepID=A0AAD5DI46_9CHLO|nr:hypothetical protein COHA_009496 [Chlorella ohadii]